MSAYLLLRGMKTLDLRVKRQNESALRIAQFLESHPAVERVFYPGLESHAGHAIARHPSEQASLCHSSIHRVGHGWQALSSKSRKVPPASIRWNFD